MDFRSLCESASKIVKEVGDFIYNEQKKLNSEDIRFKEKNDLVSYVDVEAEKKLIKGLTELLPDSEVLAEESRTNVQGIENKTIWIIDPLDGTTNYLHSIPVYSISVALMVNGKLEMGIVYEINCKENFYAYGNRKAYLNGEEIRVTTTDNLQNSLIATGFPYKLFGKIDHYMKILKGFMIGSRGVRRLGSAAVDLVYVACGRFDGFYEYDLNPWDVAAGAFIVQQAGGKVTDFRNGKDFIFGGEILASNGLVHEEMEGVIALNLS